MRFYYALISAALLIETLTGVGLAWDGSYTLFNVLDTQSPEVSYGRITQVPLHWIVVVVSQVTRDLNVLRGAFVLIYAALTLLALAASWWIVRSREGAEPLFVWAALGIGLGTLPGQVCAVCQSMLSMQLFYPIVLAILIGIPRRTVPVVALLAVVILFLHPVAFALFPIAAALALLVGLRYPDGRRRLWLGALAFGALGVIAWLRFMLFRSAYETGELSLKVLTAHFYDAVAGIPILALVCVWFAALLIFLDPLFRRTSAGTLTRAPFDPAQGKPREQVISGAMGRLSAILARTNVLYFLTLASLATAGILLIFWASDPHRWAKAIDFREWAPFVSLPFLVIATLDVTLGQATNASRAWPQRARLIQLTGLVFFFVVSIQGFNWLNLTNRLQETMRASPATCLSGSSLGWLQGTPLEHWSLTANSLVLQERRPEKLVMAGNGCTDESFLPGLVVAQFGPGDWNLRNWLGGWFDLQVIAQQLTAAEQIPPRCTFPLTAGWYGIERSESEWHRWTGGHARIHVLLAQDTQSTLQGEIVSIQQPNEVQVLLNGKPAATLEITQGGWQSFGPIPLALGRGENFIELISRNPPSQIPTDSRWLAFALGNPTLTLEDGETICR